ncbi:MAG: lysophospholipid acyltransferase family protein [Chitinophagaceae bacterium]
MKVLIKFVQVLYTIYAFLLFVFMLIIVFPLVVIASFFGRIKGGNFIYRLVGIWADIWLPMLGIFHKNIFIGQHKTDHACIFVANHISYMDVPILVKSLRQPVRVLGKMELSRIPIFGFLYRNAVVMVNRSNSENRAKSVKTLTSILKKDISIFIYPEGTFNTSGQPLQDFFNGAFRIAIETQTPIKPIVFPDTVKLLHYNNIFSLTPGISRAIFLEEIPVDNLSMDDIEWLKMKVYNEMDAELRKWAYYEEPKAVLKTTNFKD